MGVGAALLAAGAAAAEDGWELVSQGRITVKARERSDSPVREIWAEGPIDAPVLDIQNALLDVERLSSFMPYVKESRYLGGVQPDGSWLTYTRLELPMMSSRDYVSRIINDELVGPDGGGEFRQRWLAEKDRLPRRANVIRLALNEGGWHVRPVGEGKSWAVFRTRADPGGWVPAFVAELGHRTAMSNTFAAVEKEAQRRYAERKSDASEK